MCKYNFIVFSIVKILKIISNGYFEKLKIEFFIFLKEKKKKRKTFFNDEAGTMRCKKQWKRDFVLFVEGKRE